MVLRIAAKWVWVKVRGGHFDAFDRPAERPPPSFYTGGSGVESPVDESGQIPQGTIKADGKFF